MQQLLYSRRHYIGGHATSHVPAMPGYIRFPQLEKTLSIQSVRMIREIWLLSLQCRDYECAAQALFSLSQVAAVTHVDFLRFSDMLLVAKESHTYIKYLAQAALQQVPKGLTHSKRHDIMALLLQLLCEIEDFPAARSLATNKWIATVHGSSPSLLAMSCIISFLQASRVANSALQDCDIAASMRLSPPVSLLDHPLNFLWLVRLLLKANQGLKLIAVDKNYKGECGLVLMEADIAAKVVLSLQECWHWTELQGLLLAYLIGSNQRKQALEHVGVLIKWLGDPEVPAFCAARLCGLLSDLLIVVSPDDSLNHIYHGLLKFQERIMLLSPEVNDFSIYRYWAFFRLKVLSKNDFLLKVVELLEVLIISEGTVYQMHGPASWLLWQLLVNLLGDVLYLKDDHPIGVDSGILEFHPESAFIAGRAKEIRSSARTKQAMKSKSPQPLPQRDKAHNEESYPLPPLNEGKVGESTQLLRDKISWWLHSMLSASSLGDFSVMVLPHDADMVNKLLDSVPSMPLLEFPVNSKMRVENCGLKMAFEKLKQRVSTSFDLATEEDEVEDVPAVIDFSEALGSLLEAHREFNDEEMALIVALCSEEDCLTHQELFKALAPNREESELFAVRKVKLVHPLNKVNYRPRKHVPHVEDPIDYLLGTGILVTLTCQALVAAHLSSSDHLFVLRAVQVLVLHATESQCDEETRQTALSCLKFLRDHNVNISRCIHLAAECYHREVAVRSAPPQLFSMPDVIKLTGPEDSHYQPLPFEPTS